MPKAVEIKGTVRKLDFEGGFWGIESQDGKKYTPIDMPEQLKMPDAEIVVTIEILEDAYSLSMWGEAVRIVGFETVNM